MLGRQRGDGEAAVTADDGGDAMQGRRAEGGVPEGLGVVMGVDVNEARGDQVAGRVDFLDRFPLDRTDAYDTAVLDGDVGSLARAPGTVDHGAVTDDAIQHGVLPSLRKRQFPTAETAGAGYPLGNGVAVNRMPR